MPKNKSILVKTDFTIVDAALVHHLSGVNFKVSITNPSLKTYNLYKYESFELLDLGSITLRELVDSKVSLTIRIPNLPSTSLIKKVSFSTYIIQLLEKDGYILSSEDEIILGYIKSDPPFILPHDPDKPRFLFTLPWIENPLAEYFKVKKIYERMSLNNIRGGNLYRVKNGDTWSGIASEIYGDPIFETETKEENKQVYDNLVLNTVISTPYIDTKRNIHLSREDFLLAVNVREGLGRKITNKLDEYANRVGSSFETLMKWLELSYFAADFVKLNSEFIKNIGEKLFEEITHLHDRIISTLRINLQKEGLWENNEFGKDLGGKITSKQKPEPTPKTKMRAKVFKEIKDANPEWTQDKVAIKASETLGEVSSNSVRYAYRCMGLKWKRGDRIR